VCLVGSLFARGVEWTCSRSGDRTNDEALGVGHRSVIWVLVVCDHGAWGLWFGAGWGSSVDASMSISSMERER